MSETPAERDIAPLVAHLVAQRRAKSSATPAAPAAAPGAITEAMVRSATLAELERWKDDLEWDDDALPWINDRIQELAEAAHATTPEPPSTTPAVAPARATAAAAAVPKTAREVFEESLENGLPKRAIMGLYDNSPALAESVRDEYSAQQNPRVSEELLLQLQAAGLLWLSWEVGRVSAGGSNSMIYKFHLSKTTQEPVGEWHVHWESRGRAANPGWKVGRDGEKVGGDDLGVMKKLIGPSLWGKIGGFGGTRRLAGT